MLNLQIITNYNEIITNSKRGESTSVIFLDENVVDFAWNRLVIEKPLLFLSFIQNGKKIEIKSNFKSNK